MKLRSLCCAFIALLLGTGNVLAWDAEGHEVVGAIADKLLHKNAKQKVAQILGFELGVAAPWGDCVRSVVRHKDGTFEYVADPRFEAPCIPFETDAEKARMADYVSRNWDNCTYNDKPTNCHKAFHFADVAIQHDGYDRRFVGTSDHDVVSAINAAVAVLQGRPAPPPFSIKDQKEALFMLSHFVGDLHQPLHVAAVYLDQDGNRVNPDDGGLDPDTETAGGNSIREEHGNLHGDWDDVPSSLRRSGLTALVAKARSTPRTPGQIQDWAVTWASDTVVQGHDAFTGVAFTGAGHHKWQALFEDEPDYDKREAALKRTQLIKGGAHLAELLNTVWP